MYIMYNVHNNIHVFCILYIIFCISYISGIDLMYSVTLLSISLTPTLYILTTPKMKGVLRSWLGWHST